jgi:hypothetical protein
VCWIQPEIQRSFVWFITRSCIRFISVHHHLEKIHNIVDAEVLRRRLATSPTEPRHDFELKEFEELLTKFIATSCLSLRIVDSPDFRSLLSYIRPGIKIPDRKRLSTVLLPLLREKVEGKVRDRLANITHYSLTTDTWKSIGNGSYMAVTLHAVNPNGSWSFSSWTLWASRSRR